MENHKIRLLQKKSELGALKDLLKTGNIYTEKSENLRGDTNCLYFLKRLAHEENYNSFLSTWQNIIKN